MTENVMERARLRMRQGAACSQLDHWDGAIQALAQGLWEQPQLGMHFAAALERARLHRWQRRRAALSQGQAAIAVLVVRTSADPAALRRAAARSRIHARLGHQVSELVVGAEDGEVAALWQRCLQHPADLLHLCDPSLPAVLVGLFGRLLWGATVVATVDDRDPSSGLPLATVSLETLKRTWGGLPAPEGLLGSPWAGLALHLCRGFQMRLAPDPAVQLRLGGTLIDEAGDGPALEAICRQLGDGLGDGLSDGLSDGRGAGLAGDQLAVLESLAPALASPLLAHRFWRWNAGLQARARRQASTRDPLLTSIVIPVYGDPDELDRALASVRAARVRSRWQVIAVMNDATAATRQVLERHRREDPRIQAVWPGENTQFALGCNLGALAGSGERIVLLNNDCRVADGWLDALVEPLQDPAIAAVQPRLVKPDGRVQCLGVVFADGQTLGYPLYAGLPSTLPCTRRDHRLQALTGACLAFRFADLLQVGGLDCRYINSQEDVDLCLRLLKLPDRRYCLATAATTVVHAEARAPGRFNHKEWSRRRFVQRWHGRIQPDDLALYRADGVRHAGHRRDVASFEREGIGAGRAILEPA